MDWWLSWVVTLGGGMKYSSKSLSHAHFELLKRDMATFLINNFASGITFIFHLFTVWNKVLFGYFQNRITFGVGSYGLGDGAVKLSNISILHWINSEKVPYVLGYFKHRYSVWVKETTYIECSTYIFCILYLKI